MKTLHIILVFVLFFSVSAGAQSVTMYTTGFETGDVIPTYNSTTGTMSTGTSSAYQGTKVGNILAASSSFDGSFITPLQSLSTGCTYTVSFYCQVFGATTCYLVIEKSATATNAAMKAASGTDIIMSSTTINWGSYQRISTTFTVLSGESKYIGLQLQGTGSSVQFFVDNWTVTRNCDHCSNGIQDADETAVDCGGADCPNASPVAGTISPTSATIAAAGSQTITLSGYTGDIQWQYSNDNSTWYDAMSKTSSSYAVTNITSTTYYRAKVTYGGCTPTPVYSGTCTITCTGITTKTWNGSSSTAWGTNANWTPSGVPTAANNVVISSGGNQPSIASNINAFCNDLTINSGATLTVNCGGAKVFEISGNITCNGTINHASTKLMHLIGVNKTLSGDLSSSNNLWEMDACSYRLSGTVKMYELTIDNNASPGCVSLGSNTLVIVNKLTQNGLIYQETGTLQIEDPQAVMSQGNFYYGTGTTYFAKGTNSTIGGQWVVGPFTFYNLKMRNSTGAISHLGDNQGSITCTNLEIYNPVGGSFSGWCHIDDAPLYVTGNLTIDSYADLDAEDETDLVSVNMFVGGNITNNGRFEQRKNTVTLNGTGNQYIGGSSTTSFYNLTSSKTSGKIILNGNVIVGTDDPQPVKSSPYIVYATDLTGVLTLVDEELDLNGYTLTFANPATTAYTRTSGFVVSENNVAVNPSIIKWQMGSTTGAHVYPFATASGASNYIPFTFNKTTAGSCDISVSTRATSAADNTPLAGVSSVAAVSSMPSASTDVIDRWWDITASAGVTGNLTFTYKGAENTTLNPTENIGAAHWNGSSWDSPVGSSAGVTSGTGTLTVTGASTFSPWVLSKAVVPLPIGLAQFAAQLVGSIVHISWVTESEINNDYFTVEKTQNFNDIVEVITMPGAGNSTTKQYYKATDENPFTNLSYYRLKMMDKDGTVSHSKWVMINRMNDRGLVVIPNPMKGNSFRLRLPEIPASSCYVFINNIAGKQIYAARFNDKISSDILNLSGIPFGSSGLYYINVEIDGMFYHDKVSVEAD
jgi:hypothetical protein